MSEPSPSAPGKAGPPKKQVSPARNAIGLVVLIAVVVVGCFEVYAKYFGYNPAANALDKRLKDEDHGLPSLEETEKLIGKPADDVGGEVQVGGNRFLRKTYTWKGLINNYTLAAYYRLGSVPALDHIEANEKFEPQPAQTPPPAPSGEAKGGMGKGGMGKGGTGKGGTGKGGMGKGGMGKGGMMKKAESPEGKGAPKAKADEESKPGRMRRRPPNPTSPRRTRRRRPTRSPTTRPSPPLSTRRHPTTRPSPPRIRRRSRASNTRIHVASKAMRSNGEPVPMGGPPRLRRSSVPRCDLVRPSDDPPSRPARQQTGRPSRPLLAP